jgi:hypothetical protein
MNSFRSFYIRYKHKPIEFDDIFDIEEHVNKDKNNIWRQYYNRRQKHSIIEFTQ